jgi:hypothetical protein
MPIWNILDPGQYSAATQFYGIRGGNPLLAPLQMSGLGFGSRILEQIAFGNQLEPDRQDAMRFGLNLMAPGGDQARVDAFRNRAMSFASQNGRLLQAQQRELGSGAGPALAFGLMSDAARASTDYARFLSTPEVQSAQLQGYLGLLNGGQSLSGLTTLSALAAQLDSILDSGRTGQSSGGGIGGLLQAVAQLAGLGLFG